MQIRPDDLSRDLVGKWFTLTVRMLPGWPPKKLEKPLRLITWLWMRRPCGDGLLLEMEERPGGVVLPIRWKNIVSMEMLPIGKPTI